MKVKAVEKLLKFDKNSAGVYRYVMSPEMYSSQNQGGDNGGGDDGGMDRFRCKKAAIEREQC